MEKHEDPKKDEILITETIKGSDHGDDSPESSASVSIKSKVNRLFGRQQSVHKILAADVFLWRNKKVSAGVLGGATAIWLLFDVLEYHFLTLICNGLILTLAVLFLWSNASFFLTKWVTNHCVCCCISQL
ncbi:hypothetical protein Leryth_019325 [Lithospermum erythrorhizon]|nr:hypothetical protein Leryth_019325 [Lithospermum erythrorhizon]